MWCDEEGFAHPGHCLRPLLSHHVPSRVACTQSRVRSRGRSNWRVDDVRGDTKQCMQTSSQAQSLVERHVDPYQSELRILFVQFLKNSMLTPLNFVPILPARPPSLPPSPHTPISPISARLLPLLFSASSRVTDIMCKTTLL